MTRIQIELQEGVVDMMTQAGLVLRRASGMPTSGDAAATDIDIPPPDEETEEKPEVEKKKTGWLRKGIIALGYFSIAVAAVTISLIVAVPLILVMKATEKTYDFFLNMCNDNDSSQLACNGLFFIFRSIFGNFEFMYA